MGLSYVADALSCLPRLGNPFETQALQNDSPSPKNEGVTSYILYRNSHLGLRSLERLQVTNPDYMRKVLPFVKEEYFDDFKYPSVASPKRPGIIQFQNRRIHTTHTVSAFYFTFLFDAPTHSDALPLQLVEAGFFFSSSEQEGSISEDRRVGSHGAPCCRPTTGGSDHTNR